MGDAWRLGFAAGLAGSVVAVAVNLLRGEPHLVSVLPDLLTAVALTALLAVAVHLAGRPAGRVEGLRVSVAAGVTFGAAMSVFTLAYLPNHSIGIAAFAAVTSFAIACALGAVVTGLDSFRGLKTQ